MSDDQIIDAATMDLCMEGEGVQAAKEYPGEGTYAGQIKAVRAARTKILQEYLHAVEKRAINKAIAITRQQLADEKLAGQGATGHAKSATLAARDVLDAVIGKLETASTLVGT